MIDCLFEHLKKEGTGKGDLPNESRERPRMLKEAWGILNWRSQYARTNWEKKRKDRKLHKCFYYCPLLPLDHLSKPNVWIEFYLSLNMVSPEKCPNSSSLLILTWLLPPWLWNKVLLNLADGHSLVFAQCFDGMKAVHPMYVFMHKYHGLHPKVLLKPVKNVFLVWCLTLAGCHSSPHSVTKSKFFHLGIVIREV